MKPTLLPKAVIWGNSRGPKVGPGTYAVRVKLGDRTVARDVEVRPHPMVQATADDLAKQFRLLSDLRDRLSEAHEAVAQIRDVRAQAKALHERAEKLGKGEALKARFAGLKEALERVERKLVNPDLKSSQDVLNFPPALDHQIAGLAGTVASADAAPTDASWTFYGECQGKLAEVLAELGAVLDKELADFNQAARDLNWPPVMVVPPKPGS
jgi:hypothetical protein